MICADFLASANRDNRNIVVVLSDEVLHVPADSTTAGIVRPIR